ncbi:MAG: 30S ribosomal protein S1 [Deltaproteobacteria bacterium]|nr:MAG: 30S ribosomal protein S1 [Deltaproteobacteria bacterium]
MYKSASQRLQRRARSSDSDPKSKQQSPGVSKKIKQASIDGSILRGTVFRVTRKGYEVSIENEVAFCPRQYCLNPRTCEQYGANNRFKTYFRVWKCTSRRPLLVEVSVGRRGREWCPSLKPGDRVSGFVSRVTDYGAFVDLGGVTGLVHISELDDSFVKSVGDFVHVEQLVQVVLLAKDQETRRLSLSMRPSRLEAQGNNACRRRDTDTALGRFNAGGPAPPRTTANERKLAALGFGGTAQRHAGPKRPKYTDALDHALPGGGFDSNRRRH